MFLLVLARVSVVGPDVAHAQPAVESRVRRCGNYGPAAVRAYHRAFTGASGTAELHLFPPIGHDGHIRLPWSGAVWSSAVAEYLRRIGLGDRG